MREPTQAYLLLELKFVKAKILQLEKITGLTLGDKAISRKMRQTPIHPTLPSQNRTERGQEGKKISAEGKGSGPISEKGENDGSTKNGS